ncbi:bifunctional (p)ppGpp synthetase/guanosine-3',5'-bis(diphosphate) 3'-pyrophosphohydrolase [Paenalcaligenes niemegkensis]|uniref:RelA/SpoT family protein n=1 Tax=Paenalcaligenes niemegkensis TaxID=2895469 RepID=UPI001EE9ACEF|nr:bifunctional (p)ppGpp synthetase/guanosine-3',5'-bis(diphosphate) 3'-pyrophosphohydrolase [Paenalcaligenes niemegkensis]MCQ9616902.1 bifunctional (p)ppGpp synthetase/guanosine-3',5'-bis(diphosphate) 3'-pyrophosphohydrolase [Paenalcaligenes niemegkensis]
MPVSTSDAIPDELPARVVFSPRWLEKVCADLDEAGTRLLHTAAATVALPLNGVLANTGEALDSHSAHVVEILQSLGSDAVTRASALLAVLPEPEVKSSGIKDNDILKEFGPEVAKLVQGTRALYRLGTLTGQSHDQAAPGSDQKEMKRRMLLAMAVDLRIVLLRLASRLQSLRWYAESKTPCPQAFAKETMELYTPLANRLGIWQVKWEMEDLAFRFLQPATYKDIAKQLEEKRVEREAFITAVVKQLTESLAEEGMQAEVYGRPKHIYSIWNKMRNKDLNFNQLFDLQALRIIVDDERSCYSALALVHALWTPVPAEFDDYISRPKPNGYRSLHTVVADEQGRNIEIQIRTHEMHEFAEFGMAAHWRYKEAGRAGGTVAATADEQKVAWMRQLLAWDKNTPAEPGSTDVQAAHADPGQEQGRTSGEHIYVLTPQARVIELPVGATPVDFAYYLHTDLGHRCRGAKVDGHMVPLLTKLSTGQTVEIIAAKSGGPSRDWLNTQLGFLASPRSRAKVRAWFNAVELQQRISQGQTMVEKELQRLGKTATNLELLAQRLGFARADDLYVAVAKDEFSLRHIDHSFKQAPAGTTDPETRVFSNATSSVTRTGKSGVLVVGVDSLLTQLARCCRPAPPDPIVGFVTRGRGVSIHRSDCHSYAGLILSQPERAIDVDWGDTGDALYPVDLHINAQERPSLLRDISEVFARLRVNVVGVSTQSRRSLSQMTFTIEVTNGEQIQRALAALQEIPGVEASRQ